VNTLKESLRRNISDSKISQKILCRFSGAKRLAIHAERSFSTAIPREEREAIFERLRDVAEQYGIGLHICGCKNPDIPVSLFSLDCRLSVSWNQRQPQKDLLDSW